MRSQQQNTDQCRSLYEFKVQSRQYTQVQYVSMQTNNTPHRDTYTATLHCVPESRKGKWLSVCFRSLLPGWLMEHRWRVSDSHHRGPSSCFHGLPVFCETGGWQWPMLSYLVTPNPMKNGLSWDALSGVRVGSSCGWSDKKGSWFTHLDCGTPAPSTCLSWWPWDVVYGKEGQVGWAAQTIMLACCSVKAWLRVLWKQGRPGLKLLCIWSYLSLALLREVSCHAIHKKQSLGRI